MSETSSNAGTEYNYKKEINEFLKLAEESSVNLDAWKNASLNMRSNREMLREEMESTITDVNEFVSQMEQQAKMRKFRRRTYGEGEWTKLSAKERYFTEALLIGEEVMKKLVEAITAKPDPVINEPLLSLTDVHKKIEKESDPTRKLALQAFELVTRFARLLDGEGIPHKYPVPKVEKKAKTFRRLITEEEEEHSKSPRKSRLKSSESRHTSTMSSQFEDSTRSAGAFLRDYAEKNNLTPVYREISAVKTTWQQEYVSTCKLDKLVGEGKAKRRSLAKQIAAAHVLRQLISKSRRNTLPENMPRLTEEEIKDAVVLTCEYIEYGTELQAICSQENCRPPLYTPIIKPASPIENYHVEMRCKALGYNAVGYGRDKEVAKRMAAKFVLDLLIEDREKTLAAKSVSYPTSKIDWNV